MNALLALLLLVTGVGVSVFVPQYGSTAVLVGAGAACLAGYFIYRVEIDRRFLLQLFAAGLVLRVAIGTIIFVAQLQDFFGGDAITYDGFGYALLRLWQGEIQFRPEIDRFSAGGGWGMLYLVAAVYAIVGRNPLAIQFINAVIGSATAVVIYLCAYHIFRNVRVARLAAFALAFFPSIILWSSQGLKDAPVVFSLALAMLATLKLGERWSLKYLLVLIIALFSIFSLRFYIFYMLVAAIAGSFIVGMRELDGRSIVRQFAIVVCIGLAMTYLGVLRQAGQQFESYGSLEAVQRSREDLARSARSGFAADVDVSTTSGALQVIPIGVVYLLFAPFPWQVEGPRQIITLPEMVIWWSAFPFVLLGGWFTIRYRLRQTLPILIFTAMLTLAYSVFQGNVGTAYRQRAQLLVFYFIFAAVGFIFLKEKSEERDRAAERAREAILARRAAERALQRRHSGSGEVSR
ncbi:MAG: hypothetical protein C4334_08590 [Pyrinomonas sp.]|uniref:glycosyltransferase family 39 protein n=1 Tax=Pyrinomonas sp. TaxID=2080306 RepID=UPI00331D58EC